MLVSTMVAAVALSVLSAQPQAGPTKPAPADVGPGRIAWFDLSTSDLPKAKEFYGKLFDWTFAAVPGTDFAVEIISRGEAVGTLRVAEGKVSPYNGVVYVQVNDIQASCQRAKELGGTIPPGFPFNLTDRPGAIALVVDPAGHPVGLYARTPIR
jgi:predicted enzyme related to lactoylglutathione lyase